VNCCILYLLETFFR